MKPNQHVKRRVYAFLQPYNIFLEYLIMLLVLSGGAGRIHPLHIAPDSLKFGLIGVLTIFEVLHPSDHLQDCFTLFLLCQFDL
jgi:hypothetical protein